METDEPTQELEGSDPFTRVAERVLASVADDAAKRVVGQSISWLKTLDAQLSSEVGHLKNVWEELCVQWQGEESVYWDEYKETVTTDLEARIEQLRPHIQLSLWLQTTRGFEWSISTNHVDGNCPPVFQTDIAEYLWGEYILPRAEAYTNARIRLFLDRPM